MRFSELELKRFVDRGLGKLSMDDEIAFNILNFIHCIHLNKQDFYSSSFKTQYFGDLEMTFIKDADCLIGHCQVNIKKDEMALDYLFTENGFELLMDVLK